MNLRLLATLLLLVPMAVQASDLDRAVELTLQMDYQKALKLATRTLKSASSGPESLVKAYEIQGICLASLGRTKAAVQSFRRLLAIDATFRLGENVSPKILEPFEQALRESSGQPVISLTHQPPPESTTADKLELSAVLGADPLSMVKKIRLRYNPDDGRQKRKTRRVKGPGTVVIKPPGSLKTQEIRYYFEAVNQHGGVLARAGSQDQPFTVRILPPPPPVVAEVPPVVKKIEAKPVPPPPIPPISIEEKKPDDRDPDGAGAWYKQWWLWTGVGVLLTGAAVGVALAVSGGEPNGNLSYDVYIR